MQVFIIDNVEMTATLVRKEQTEEWLPQEYLEVKAPVDWSLEGICWKIQNKLSGSFEPYRNASIYQSFQVYGTSVLRLLID